MMDGWAASSSFRRAGVSGQHVKIFGGEQLSLRTERGHKDPHSGCTLKHNLHFNYQPEAPKVYWMALPVDESGVFHAYSRQMEARVSQIPSLKGPFIVPWIRVPRPQLRTTLRQRALYVPKPFDKTGSTEAWKERLKHTIGCSSDSFGFRLSK